MNQNQWHIICKPHRFLFLYIKPKIIFDTDCNSRMTEHAENRKPQTVFPRSHEDADMQDVGGTNSGKHYERARVMACQQMQERQILHGISKAPAHTITANIQEKTAGQSLPRAGAGKGTALHITTGMASLPKYSIISPVSLRPTSWYQRGGR